MNALTILGIIDGKEIWIIIAVIILIFGGSKIPQLMKGLGTGIKDFKKAVKEDDTSSKENTDPKE